MIPPSIELQLTGLWDEPDRGAATRMATFDALPTPLRQFLVDCPFDFSAVKADCCARDYGVAGTLNILRGSVTGERRRWASERQAALEWARDAFRLGPRPKHEPLPGGWTVHNFPG